MAGNIDEKTINLGGLKRFKENMDNAGVNGVGEFYEKDNTSEIFNNKNNPTDGTKNKVVNAPDGNHFIHIEGLRNTVDGINAAPIDNRGIGGLTATHIEGYDNTGSGWGCHVEGVSSKSTNDAAHAEGMQCTANGQASHSGGHGSYANGERSFSHGFVTKAEHDDEVAFGKYNVSNADTLFSVGDGTLNTPSNAFEITKTGGKLHGDDIATVAKLNEHAGNADIHVTADEKSDWNGKATLDEAAQVFSNPNLLINPWLKNPINQRRASGVISTEGYFIDRWQLVDGTAEITAGGIILNGTMKQILENAVGANVTASASAGTASYDDSTRTFTLTAAGETIEWAKLEIGSIATSFSPPNPATELAKCQRYFCTGVCSFDMKTAWYGSGAAMALARFPNTMRTDPEVNIFSYNGTPNTPSYWDMGTDVDTINDITATLTRTDGYDIIYSPGNKFINEDIKLSFKYTADAEIY